ncbi:RelA/SpoT family protein [Candidatus Methylomicrobium oryzae]|jgi:guanosine-3',5'-bis(diphosphate) 3'-pyrophosphohydrolase|uniref:RelA/SpoT family protein n=1 Tax=Candidatus Methylomicrobium oryzae TaxID=2802053 RepID=UPI0019244FEF|nr:bifunctional (p)ppGpp synthetase/guanosine-3',5'-bis(diphosphate) 3'-pyrophosphohydrolase [Methylomicrobium sp. RS1]MBL1262910.1 bifunctional (p)ppGpp synthetase/guanosine-3',5'-bis(diphosphate) 3'-pyrophosphohydrolase [Methylomicrobium sp. RS1]
MLEIADPIELERPQDKLVRRLCEILGGYLDPSQIDDCVRAYEFSATAHSGQFRKSGEAYICHPVAVAISLAEMRMDANCIMAAILHDVIEDTPISKAELAAEFSLDVAELVDGVTKLTKIDGISRAEAQAENVRKMFMAMTRDLRIIMVKLADRLHNMQTLGVMPSEKKRRIAKETLDIYAPLANRLGMNNIQQHLEVLSFEAMYPRRYAILKTAVKKTRGSGLKTINTVENSVKNRMSQAGIVCEVSGREKNLYSIYTKMRHKKISLPDIFDVYAFRICVDTIDDCYRTIGVVHSLYNPKPGRFKDYIALPKANGYQSLHTTLIGPGGVPLEIQIRTHEMHRMAESGIAAHWLYKSDDDKHEKFQKRANEWLKDILEIQKSAGDSLEFIENLKVDLFPQEVFVFTPKGNIVKVPRGSTVVDFAYAVHTDIGNQCISARIDKQLAPLQTKLENGVMVDIITAPWARPNPLWLNFVITAKARSSIRSYLKNFNRKEAILLGRRLLEKELQAMDLHLEQIDEKRIHDLLKLIAKPSLDDLLEDIGLGNKMPFLIAKRLSQDDVHGALKLEDTQLARTAPLIIKGTEGMIITLAKCCRPIPGDAIVGFYNPGKGIVVHHNECHNSSDTRKKQANWLEVEWSQDLTTEFPAELRLEVMNRTGTLATILAAISEMNSNIENVSVADQDDKICVDLITLSVKNRVHLAEIMRKLKKLPIVVKLERVRA